MDRRLLELWPRDLAGPALPRDSRRSVFLFLQIAYAGGVWETTKELMQELAAINRERGGLKLTLGIHEEQEDTRSLEHLGEVGFPARSGRHGSALHRAGLLPSVRMAVYHLDQELHGVEHAISPSFSMPAAGRE